MAGIEKVCELCGDYLGWKMYELKRNHIQVCKKCRNEFAGKESTLILFKPDIKDYQFSWFLGEPRQIRKYEYCLKVNDIQGNVKGMYYNQTYDKRGFGKIVRRMRKFVGKENLTTVTENSIIWEFITKHWPA